MENNVIRTYIIQSGEYKGATVKVLKPAAMPKYICRVYGRDTDMSDDVFGRIHRGETLKVAGWES